MRRRRRNTGKEEDFSKQFVMIYIGSQSEKAYISCRGGYRTWLQLTADSSQHGSAIDLNKSTGPER